MDAREAYEAAESARRRTDRAVGYATMGLVLLLCAFVAWKMHAENGRGVQTVTVRFPDLGSLQPQDAVVERGVRVGHVREASLRGNAAEVVIDFGVPVRYCKGTRFINSNYSLMGQRYIVIMPEHRGEELDLSQPQEGEWEPGIAEAMHLVQDAVSALDSLMEVVKLVARGDAERESFASEFNGLVGSLETGLETVDRMVSKKGPELQNALAGVERTAGKANETLAGAQGIADTALTAVRAALAGMSEAVSAVRTAVDGAGSGLDSLERSEVWTKLAGDKGLYESMAALNADLKRVLEQIGGAGETEVSAWKLMKKTNWNVLGATAREKRAKRAAEAEKGSGN